MNIGAGRVVYQSLLINNAIKTGAFFKMKDLRAKEWADHNSKLHMFGVTSDGGVHSHLNHIKAILKMAKDFGLETAYFHAFMDGRDVDPQKGPVYIKEILDEMAKLQFGQLASIGGRYYVMDRDKNLDRVDVAYQMMVNRKGASFTDYNE